MQENDKMEDPCNTDGEEETEEDKAFSNLPFPGFADKVFFRLEQTTQPRHWCLKIITWPWFERISMAVILLNCVTLGLYQPCIDVPCTTTRCKVLEIFDHCIFAFFAMEMCIKVLAMGFIGKEMYLADTWNRLDLFIVMAGAVEYVVSTENLNLSAIRTVRVLRPIRAINRIPSLRILVTLLLDTLPMLGNVLLLCFFVFFIFGIIGVQLWSGLLRNRCFLELPPNISNLGLVLPDFYNDSGKDFICSHPDDEGMTKCHDLSHFIYKGMLCNDSAESFDSNNTSNSSCVDWNQYYTSCKSSDYNPFQGAISFDNIGLAWVAIFQVISLAGWVNIMYFVQDAHSFWDWIYFVALIIVGAFFMINLCLVVIATQFSETKKREMERMLMERKRFHSSSTLASNSEPGGCYDEMIKYISHLMRKSHRRINRFVRRTVHARRRVTPERAVSMTLQPRRKKRHHKEKLSLSPSITLDPSSNSHKRIISNVDSLHATLDALDSLDSAELGMSDVTIGQRPTYLHVNNVSISFPSVISLFSSNSLPTPPTLKLCSPPYVNRTSSVCSDFTGKYLLVPLEIIRTGNLQSTTRAGSSINEKAEAKLHSFSRAASLNCETCGGSYLPVVQIEDGRQRKAISRAASLVVGNYLPVPSESGKGRRTSIIRAVSLSTEPYKNRLLVPKDGTEIQQRNSISRATSLNSEHCQIYLPASNESSKSHQNSINTRATSLHTEPCITACRMYIPLSKKNAAIESRKTSVVDNELCKSYLPIPRIGGGRRNSVGRASSLNSGEACSRKYMPFPDEGVRSKRNSINRAGSLNSGPCRNHLSILNREILQKRQNPVSRIDSQTSDKCGNYLLVPGEMVGKRRPSISRTLSLNIRTPEDPGTARTFQIGNRLNAAVEKNVPKQRISVIRASSFCSESLGKYLPLPNDGRRRRSSVGRASSLNSGTCGKYHPLALDKTSRCRSAVVASSNSRLSTDYLNKVYRSMHTVKFNSKGEKQSQILHLNYNNRRSYVDIRRHSTDAETESSDEEPDDNDEDDDEHKQKSLIVHYWSRFRMMIKDFINNKYCQRGVLAAILINTLSMGIEYHNQPDILTYILEYSNLLFSCLFAFEMLLKILADGLFGYIKNGFNVFDGFIVVLSLVELMQGGAGGLSVLRTFRLLRILKLVRFLPALRYQLVVMLRTMDNVAMFFALLVLFIFIFSILGMNLFGCKFCEMQSGLETARRGCKRKNFDSLLWAIITVFQILTQEDWHEVLYIGMSKTSQWASLYFIALMTFGNYVLFNLLVAILVEGFSAEAEAEGRKKEEEREEGQLRRKSKIKDINKLEEKGLLLQLYSCKLTDVSNVKDETEDIKNNKEKEKIMLGLPTSITVSKDSDLTCDLSPKFPPIITHTAATPMATPQSSPNEIGYGVRDPRNTLAVEHAFPPSLHSSTGLLEKVPSLISILPGTPQLQRKSSLANASDWQMQLRKSIDKMDGSLDYGGNDKESARSTLFILNLAPNKPDSDHNESVPLNNHRDISHLGSPNSASLNTQNRVLACRQNSITSYRSEGLSRQNSVRTPLSLTPQSSVGSNSFDEYRHNNLTPGITGELDLKKSTEKVNKDNCSGVVDDNCQNNDYMCQFSWCKRTGCFETRANYTLFLLPPSNRLRELCLNVSSSKKFDFTILLFIALNCITLAMERPDIPADSMERYFLNISNYGFTFIFSLEMTIKVIAKGFLLDHHAYLKSGWNIMDGCLVVVSIIDVIISLTASHNRHIFGILRVFRLLRTLRPLRVISRAPGLKLVVQTLLSSLRPIGNIVLICCTFFIIFGILGVQLFKGTFYHCEGPDVKNIVNKTDCINKGPPYRWINSKYNFDNLGQALMALFVLASKDGWVNIMYTGLDAVGVDQQPRINHNEWCLVYFISFLLLVGFFVLNMFVGVVVENFHKCRESQEQEEKARRDARHVKKLQHKRKKLLQPPYWSHYSKLRLWLHMIIGSKYFDLAIASVIGINVVTMSIEYYSMPKELYFALKIFNFLFTSVFVLEAIAKVIALGILRYIRDRWNQLDVGIVVLSVVGIALEEIKSGFIPINPTIIRVMRVLRIARVLKLLKMARSVRALLDTVMQALPEVGNLGLLFFLLFYIFAALGVELFGRIDCSYQHPCEGLDKHAHFHNFGMAFLTLFRVATGDNWNGIMKDTLRDDCDSSDDCVHNCCVSRIIAPVFFVVFVLMAQFVLVNVVVAVLMKHLEESHKHMDEYANLEAEVLQAMEEEEARNNELHKSQLKAKDSENDLMREEETSGKDGPTVRHQNVSRQGSLPTNFTFNICPPSPERPDSRQSMMGVGLSSLLAHNQHLQLPIIRTESRLFLPDGTVQDVSKASFSEIQECISITIPTQTSVLNDLTQKLMSPPQADNPRPPRSPRSPRWVVSKGNRGPLSRQNAVSQSSTPDSTPRLLSPADGQVFTPISPGLSPIIGKSFNLSPRMSPSPSPQDDNKFCESELTRHSGLSVSPWGGKQTTVCNLRRSSSSASTRPNLNNLWKDSPLQPLNPSSSTGLFPGQHVGSHLSRSKSHPRPRTSQHDLCEDIDMFDPYPRENRFNAVSDTVVMESSSNDKERLDRSLYTNLSFSRREDGVTSPQRQEGDSEDNFPCKYLADNCSLQTTTHKGFENIVHCLEDSQPRLQESPLSKTSNLSSNDPVKNATSTTPSPSRPQFLSLTTSFADASRKLPLKTLGLSVTSLTANLLLTVNKVASPVSTPLMIRPFKTPMTRTPPTMSTTSPPPQPAAASGLCSISVDVTRERHRRCSEIGRMRVISDSDDEFLADNKS